MHTNDKQPNTLGQREFNFKRFYKTTPANLALHAAQGLHPQSVDSIQIDHQTYSIQHTTFYLMVALSEPQFESDCASHQITSRKY